MDNYSNESIGKRIANLRKNRNLTQNQLADLIGNTPKHISEIERGVTGMSIDTQLQLSKYLNCSIDYLIKGEDFKSVDYLLPPYMLILRALRTKRFSGVLKSQKLA